MTSRLSLPNERDQELLSMLRQEHGYILESKKNGEASLQRDDVPQIARVTQLHLELAQAFNVREQMEQALGGTVEHMPKNARRASLSAIQSQILTENLRSVMPASTLVGENGNDELCRWVTCAVPKDTEIVQISAAVSTFSSAYEDLMRYVEEAPDDLIAFLAQRIRSPLPVSPTPPHPRRRKR
jgi:hypothetical protein